MRVIIFTILLLTAFSVFAQGDDELLPPEEAFAFSYEVVDEQLVATWRIASGYYMYQDKFVVDPKSEDVKVKELLLPVGKTKDDPIFGEVVVYTERVNVQVPIDVENSTEYVELDVWGQGCNEPIGVCYPPIKNEVSLPASLFRVANAATTQSDSAMFDRATNLLGGLLSELPSVTEDELLEVDEAFKLSVLQPNGERLLAYFEVAKGYYLYQDKIKFEAAGDAQVQQLELPEGESMNDAFFGETIVYPTSFNVGLPLVRASPAEGRMQLSASYQGCAKDLICYPPVTKTFELSLPSLIGEAQAAEGGLSNMSAAVGASFWWLVISAFGTGLLLTFTPCVLPLIPILSSIIVGSGGTESRTRGGTLSVVYVLGTVIAYAFVGAAAGATGEQLQAYFQNVWAIGTMSVLFVLMALSLFGLYEIRMPTALESKLQEGTMKIGGGRFSAVLILGVLSALVVSACVSPLLISVLGIAIAKADPYLGAAMMTSMALGMGVILIAIGFGFGVVLPKAGPWMDRLKQGFGVMLLGVSIYLLGTIPEVPVLLLWGALFIVAGVFLGATQELPAVVSGWKHFWKGIGLVMLIWGILTFIGGVMGNRDPLRPLSQVGIYQPISNSPQTYSIDLHFA